MCHKKYRKDDFDNTNRSRFVNSVINCSTQGLRRIIIVSGIKVGDRVKALACKAKGQKWAKTNFPRTWETHFITGVVRQRERRSATVWWDGEDAGSVMATRLLFLENSTPPNAAAQVSQANTSASSVTTVDSSVVRGDAGNSSVAHSGSGDLATDHEAGDVTGDDNAEGKDGAINHAFDQRNVDAVQNPGNDDLSPHGLTWTVEQAGVVTDNAEAINAKRGCTRQCGGAMVWTTDAPRKSTSYTSTHGTTSRKHSKRRIRSLKRTTVLH